MENVGDVENPNWSVLALTNESYGLAISIRDAKCMVCNQKLIWCTDHKTYHHNSANGLDHIERRGFDPLGNPDENFYRNKKW